MYAPLVPSVQCVLSSALSHAQRARAALEPFPASPAREALDVALDFVLERDR